MSHSSAALQTHLADLNEHLEEFNEFAHSNSVSDDIRLIHFIGTPEPHQGEQALLDHWDDFLDFSQTVLNARAVSLEDALTHIDAINLLYKRILETIQSL